MRDLAGEADKPTEKALSVIAALDADLIVLTSFDYDLDGKALNALRGRLSQLGQVYPFYVAAQPNTGMATGIDLDGDGLLGGPRDAQGYGIFSGQGGLAVLSKHPVELAQDFSDLLWQDLPGNLMDRSDSGLEIQRLSSTAHWHVRATIGVHSIDLLCFSATPPVFDGPEDRNGRRNHDELIMWTHLLNGRLGDVPETPILIANTNLDPHNGDGIRQAMVDFLEKPRFQDPLPDQATALWESTGPMRVSYILPASELEVIGAGVLPQGEVDHVHLPIWVDITLR